MQTPTIPSVTIIGGGPAGLMAAEQILSAGYGVELYDAMPTVGRKFLLAGIGGLNITHSEPFAAFCHRYGAQQAQLEPLLAAFGANELRQWCAALGIDTFVGTSGRVFPKAMKAAPLLRAWLARLRQQGLRLYPRHRWQGWDAAGNLRFTTPSGEKTVAYHTLVLALGGASWRKLGSDGAWVELLAAKGIAITPLQPANCGFHCAWSPHLRQHYAGAPLKTVSLTFTDLHGQTETRQGEMIITQQGVEGSLIYAFATRLRDSLNAHGSATFYLDLLPHHRHAPLVARLQQKPPSKTWGTFLKTALKLDGIKTALVFEKIDKTTLNHPELLAKKLKAIPLTLTATAPLDAAISTAGGVAFSALDTNLMLKDLPGVFCAGEMLDWEAPTGGYLLTACFATGRHAGQGVLRYLQAR